MIRNPNDIQEGAKKIRMLIAGYPGIGKSTLALSAPNPLHIDVDFGIDRIEPRYRKPYIQPQSYDEILSDLTPSIFRTLIPSSSTPAASSFPLMSLWAIKKDPKYGQRDGSLSLKGYGFVGKEFVRLMDYCFYELQKNIVIVFHATEEKDGDNTRLRIKVEGQTRTMSGSLWTWAASWRFTAMTAPSASPTARGISPRGRAASPAFARSPHSARPALTTS